MYQPGTLCDEHNWIHTDQMSGSSVFSSSQKHTLLRNRNPPPRTISSQKQRPSPPKVIFVMIFFGLKSPPRKHRGRRSNHTNEWQAGNRHRNSKIEKGLSKMKTTIYRTCVMENGPQLSGRSRWGTQTTHLADALNYREREEILYTCLSEA